jgi:O-antigen/teichoic acid export membrane protein
LLNPLGQYYGRNLIKWEYDKNLLNATNVLLFLRLTAISFSLLLAYVLFETLSYDKYYEISEFLFFVFISLIAGTHGVLLNALNTLGDRVRFTVYAVATLLISLLLSIVFVLITNKSAMSWLYGLSITQLFFSAAIYKDLTKNSSFSFVKIKYVMQMQYIKRVVIFIVPITITLFLQWGQNQSYRFIIENKYSLEILSFIAVGLALASAIFAAVETLFQQFYNPIYLRKITNSNKKEREDAWNSLATFMVPIYILLTIFVISLSPYLTNILVAEKFEQASVYVMFGAIIEFFRVLTNLVYNVSQSELITNTTIFPYAVGFILTISLLNFFNMSEDLWLIPMSLILSYFATFTLLFIYMRQLLNIRIDIVRNIKVVILSTPLLFIFLIINDKTLLQSVLLILAGGIYFLIITYLITPKGILRILK